MRWRVALAALLLTGCTGVPVTTSGYSSSFFPGEEAAAGWDMPVVVNGNAFAMPQPQFSAAVEDAMQGQAQDVPLHFSIAGNPNAPYRVVMAFNPGPYVSESALCTRPVPTVALFGVPPAGRTPVAAAFCRGDQAMSIVTGSIGSAAGPAGADFRDGVGQVTRSLFPVQNPQTNGPNCVTGNC